MATVLDTLVFELGLDPAGLEAGGAKTEEMLSALAEAAKAAQAALKNAVGTATQEEMKRLQQAANDTQKAFDIAFKKVEQNIEEAEKKAKEAAQKMKEHGDTASEFFSKMTEKAAAFFAVIAGGMELKEFIHNQVEAQVELGRLSEHIHMNVEELDALARAATRFGGTKQGVLGALEHFGGAMARVGVQGARGGKRFAIGIQQVMGKEFTEAVLHKMKPEELLGKMREKLAGKDFFKTKSMLQMAGIGDKGLVGLMTSDHGEMEDLIAKMKEIGVITKEDTDAAMEYHHAQQDLKDAQESLGRIVMRAVLPAMKAFNKILFKLTMWANKNPETVKKVFVVLGSAIAGAAIAAAAFAVTMFSVTLPILGVAAAVAALVYLVYELYENWGLLSEGGTSALEKLVMALAVAAGTMVGMWKKTIRTMSDMGDLLVAVWDGDTKKMEKSWRHLTGDFEHDKSLFKEFWVWTKEWFLILLSINPLWIIIKWNINQVKDIINGIALAWRGFKNMAFDAIAAVVNKVADLAIALARVGVALHLPGAEKMLEGALAIKAHVQVVKGEEQTARDKQAYEELKKTDPARAERENEAALFARHPQYGKRSMMPSHVTPAAHARMAVSPSAIYNTTQSKSNSRTTLVKIETLNITPTDPDSADAIAKDIHGSLGAWVAQADGALSY